MSYIFTEEQVIAIENLREQGVLDGKYEAAYTYVLDLLSAVGWGAKSRRSRGR
jgi:hypothetical protein